MTDSTNDTDWASLVLDPGFLDKVDRMALRRFTQPGLAEEAATHALDRLSQDDWAICRQYQGRAQATSYLLTLVSHCLEEFSRHRFGRPRPPEWLKREGELWVRIWRRICLERQLPQTVIDSVCAEGRRDARFVWDILKTIKARLPWCGVSAREIPADCYDCSGSGEPGGSPLTEQLQGQALEHTLNQLHRLFFSDSRPSTEDATPHTQWQRVREQLALTPEELLLLKLVHQQGLKHKQVAELLGMPAYQPGRLLKSLHRRIARAISECGIVTGAGDHYQEAMP